MFWYGSRGGIGSLFRVQFEQELSVFVGDINFHCRFLLAWRSHRIFENKSKPPFPPSLVVFRFVALIIGGVAVFVVGEHIELRDARAANGEIGKIMREKIYDADDGAGINVLKGEGVWRAIWRGESVM